MWSDILWRLVYKRKLTNIQYPLTFTKCEFSENIIGLASVYNLSHNQYIHRMSPLWIHWWRVRWKFPQDFPHLLITLLWFLSCVNFLMPSGWHFLERHFPHLLHRFSPQYEFSDAFLGTISRQRLFHIYCTQRFLPGCELSDEQWGNFLYWRIFHIYYTHRVSPLCDFSDE